MDNLFSSWKRAYLFDVLETYELIVIYCCATRVADICETQLHYVLVDESFNCADIDLVPVVFLDHHMVTFNISVDGCGVGPCLKIEKSCNVMPWFVSLAA